MVVVVVVVVVLVVRVLDMCEGFVAFAFSIELENKIMTIKTFYTQH